MRIAFLVVLLAGGIYYTSVAFTDLGFMTRTGRLGPGFFPRVIGLSMIAITLWVIVDALRGSKENGEGGGWSDVAMLMALAIGYAVLLRLFGGFIATFLFLALTLTLLNRGRHLQNGIIAVAVPAGVYLLFDRLLNANMPPGLIDLGL